MVQEVSGGKFGREAEGAEEIMLAAYGFVPGNGNYPN